MRSEVRRMMVFAAATAFWGVSVIPCFANGGPFVVRYPAGDPAANGVLARLDPDLRPARETRLRVVNEDLSIAFDEDSPGSTPLAHVTAAYTIENPTNTEITVDFGFPVLRGIYMGSVTRTRPNGSEVTVDGKSVACQPIPTAVIYRGIRARAFQTINKGVRSNADLRKLVLTVITASSEGGDARAALSRYLTSKLKWNERDTALMVEFCSLVRGMPKLFSQEFKPTLIDGKEGTPAAWYDDVHAYPLDRYIGDQKATQLYAQLASLFDPKSAPSYERVFSAWGGDVRERSVDLKTGKVRPREISANRVVVSDGLPGPDGAGENEVDPTVYARVDYLSSEAGLPKAERDSLNAILKNLPVVFTYAPMNLLHYRVSFPAKSKQVVTVSYSQHAYADTRDPESYQIAYVVHPASLWQHFGPINLRIAAPWGVGMRASVPCKATGTEHNVSRKSRFTVYTADVTEKKGELFVAVDSRDWKRVTSARPTVQKAAK